MITDNLLFLIESDNPRKIWTSLFDKISKWADVVGYSSTMDFEFPEKYGKDGLKVFDDVGNEYYQNSNR